MQADLVAAVGAGMSVPTIDFAAALAQFEADIAEEKFWRLQPPLVRLWDGAWNLRGRVTRIISAEITEINNETGMAHLELPLDYWISDWVVDIDNRLDNIHLTVDKDGVRWSGRMSIFEVRKQEDGTGVLAMSFKHDYEELKHIICYPNPALPPEIQFPRHFFLFGSASWALKLTAFLNIARLESSAWTLPDDPLDPAGWFNLNQSTWWIVVAPGSLGSDTTMPALVHSRMKSMHEVGKKIVADAQLTWTFRRWLQGDPPPWPGAVVRHGCLVIDLVNKGASGLVTSYFGNLFTGLVKAVIGLDENGLEEGIDIADDPNIDPPPQYGDPDYLGTVPTAPWVIYRDGPGTGIQTSTFSIQPATDVGVVAGGKSAPYVNELISAAVQTAGDLIAAAIVVPPIGGALDALLKPLYTDTILAFGKWKNIARAQRLGPSRYHESFSEGADRAYTLGWLLAMRAGMWATKETISHEVVVADGAPYRIGAQGHGHFYLGDRIGSTVRGMKPGRIFIDQVSEVSLSWDRERSPGWKITIGRRENKDPVVKAWEALQDVLGLIQDLGVL